MFCHFEFSASHSEIPQYPAAKITLSPGKVECTNVPDGCAGLNQIKLKKWIDGPIWWID